jgi:hypothetical protein
MPQETLFQSLRYITFGAYIMAFVCFGMPLLPLFMGVRNAPYMGEYLFVGLALSKIGLLSMSVSGILKNQEERLVRLEQQKSS